VPTSPVVLVCIQCTVMEMILIFKCGIQQHLEVMDLTKWVKIGCYPNDNISYWIVNISLKIDDIIEFEAARYYHSPRQHYQVWSITTMGYRGYANNLTTPSSTINLSTQAFTGSS